MVDLRCLFPRALNVYLVFVISINNVTSRILLSQQ